MTIDHLVSLVLLVSVLLVSFSLYSHMLGNAIAYQRYHQVAMKAADLVDGMCLSPGIPSDWGQRNSTPSAFGLQDRKIGGYALSPFSIQRLLASSGNDPVYYPKTDRFYNNVSLGEGGSLLVPIADCVSYTTVTKMLGVNGSYGFQLSITPTLRVSVSEVNANPLKLKVEVRGPGLALSGATLKYHLYQVNKTGGGQIPSIQALSGTAQTDSAGSALLEFPFIDGSEDTYSFAVYAHLGGLNGVGYYSHNTLDDYPQFLVPFIESFDQGTIILAHNWDVHDFGTPVPNVFYNATFLVLTEDLELRPVQIENSTGQLNYGEGMPYTSTQLRPSEAGILFISYRWGNRFGTVMMPWGINALGVSVTFGGDPSGHEWVATELRQVTVNQMSYQMKLATWSLVM